MTTKVSRKMREPEIKWKLADINEAFGVQCMGVAEPLRRFITVGDGSSNSKYSLDGITWTVGGAAGFPANDIIYNNALTVYVISGSTAGVNARYSANFTAWAAGTGIAAAVSLFAIASSESIPRIVIGGSGLRLYYSNNGIAWTAATHPLTTEVVRGIAYSVSQGQFVAVADSGKIVYSSDGITWSLAADSSFGSTNIQSVAYSEALDLWVATGRDGKIAYSADGQTGWTQAASPFDGTDYLNKVSYSEGLRVFIAVSSFGTNVGKIAYSSDGKTWAFSYPVKAFGTVTGITTPNFADQIMIGAASASNNIAFSL